MLTPLPSWAQPARIVLRDFTPLTGSLECQLEVHSFERESEAETPAEIGIGGGYSASGVNYGTGNVTVSRNDLTSNGFGVPWGVHWPWTDATGYSDGISGFGGTLSGSAYAWVYGFQGMRYDVLSGMNDSQSRWYSPVLQRWTTVYPTGFKAGDVDLYRFVQNKQIVIYNNHNKILS
jgi:RHS repeat-associated protein